MEIAKNLKLSYVITVYNKADFLPHTIDSIKYQNVDCKEEFVFVDDASTDNSVEVIKNCTKGLKNVSIITNKTNKGPAIRLNQAVKKASGDYVLLMDADDILAKNAARTMLELLISNNADTIYGKIEQTELSQEQLLDMHVSNLPNYQLSTHPLSNFLQKNLVGMSYMVSRNTYLESGGCDERVFVQDESLSLRLSHKSKKFINLKNTVIYLPKEGINRLSKNKDQQHHDRFMVYKHALRDWQRKLPDNLYKKLYQKAISSAWKYQKNHDSLLDKIYDFLYYIFVKIIAPKPDFLKLDRLEKIFNSASIRKII